MYNVPDDQIESGRLYQVVGGNGINYNGVVINAGETFRGVAGVKKFTSTGEGAGLVTELTELSGFSVLFEQNLEDRIFPIEKTSIAGMTLQFELNEAEKIVHEVTNLKGMSLTFLDPPSNTCFINETRFSFNPD